MSVSRLSPLCLVLVLASPALGTFPFVYPDFRATPLPFGPHLFYGSGISGGNADLTGYSYFTKDFDGGQSEVVFFTGPNSDFNMQEEMVAMKEQMNSQPAIAPQSVPNKIGNQEMQKSDSMENQDASKITPLVPVDTKESTTVEEPSKTVSKIAKPMKEQKENPDAIFRELFDGQGFAENRPGFDAPYPILRLGNTAPFYPQLPSSFPPFGGYGPSEYFRNPYVPFANTFNSYQSPYNPLYAPLDTSYYNPGLLPTIHQSPFIQPSPVSSFVPEKPQDVLVKDSPAMVKVDKRFGEQMGNTEKKIGEESTSTEKSVELPVTTEQPMEKTTTVPEVTPTTTEETKETTTAAIGITTVLDDTVAVE